jgi:hypothetical protein
MINDYLLPRNGHVKLKNYDPNDTGSLEENDALQAGFKALKNKLEHLQDKLIADIKCCHR